MPSPAPPRIIGLKSDSNKYLQSTGLPLDDPQTLDMMQDMTPTTTTTVKTPSPVSAPCLTMRVGVKGGVSVYGLGRFPVTLYASQWDALLAQADAIKAFIGQKRVELAVKGGA